MWNSKQKILAAEKKMSAIETEILQMQDIQEQLGVTWDIDHAEHVRMMYRVDFLAGRVRDAERRVFWATALAVCLALDRLCMYFW